MISGARQILRLAAVSAVARAPAFLIPVMIAAVFGAGRVTDAYFIAYSAVLLLGGTLAQGVEQAVVPFASREIARVEGAPRAYLDVAALRTGLLALVIWAAFLPLLAAVSPSTLDRASVEFSLWFTPLAVCWCAAAVYAGTLISRWKIASATGSMIWRGAGALVGFALVPAGAGLWVVAVGLGAGEVARLWWLRQRAFADLPAADGARRASLRAMGRAAVAQVTASAAIGAAPFIERLMASSLGVGAVSHLEYAVRLLVVPAVLFEGALAPLLLARWTHEIINRGQVSVRKDILPALARGLLLAASCAAVLWLGAHWIVRLILDHGRFSPDDVAAVARLLRWLALAFVATMGALLLERYYLASARNRLLAGLSVGRVVVRLLTVWYLLPSQHLLAFPIGFAMADWGYLAALLVALRRPRVE